MTVSGVHEPNASYGDEPASIDEGARARIAQREAEEARKRADAAAHARMRVHLSIARPRVPMAQRIAGQTADTAADRQRRWVESAKAAGMKPPGQYGIDPTKATDAEIANALLWMDRGGVVPMDRLMSGGPEAYRRELVEELVLRKPGGLETLLTIHRDEATRRELVTRAMRRAGIDATCRAGDTAQTMLARYYAALAEKKRAGDAAVAALPVLGDDGLHFANAADAKRYEVAQRVAAMNPGTTMGSIASAYAAMTGASLEQIRGAGQAGNGLEGGLSMVAAFREGAARGRTHFDTTQPPQVVAVHPNVPRPPMPRGAVAPPPTERPVGANGSGARVPPPAGPSPQWIAQQEAKRQAFAAKQRLPSGRHWSDATREEFVALVRKLKPNDRTPTSELLARYDLGGRLDPSDPRQIKDVRGKPVFATYADMFRRGELPCTNAVAYRLNGRNVTFAQIHNRLADAEKAWTAAKAEYAKLKALGAPAAQLDAARARVGFASRELGEAAKDAYVASRYAGPPPPERIFPPANWTSNSGEFDAVYRVADRYGRTTIVVEAKGGDNVNYTHRQFPTGVKFQGTRGYMDDVIAAMRDSGNDTISAVGVELERARNDGNVVYIQTHATGGPPPQIEGREFDLTVDTGVKPQEPRR